MPPYESLESNLRFEIVQREDVEQRTHIPDSEESENKVVPVRRLDK